MSEQMDNPLSVEADELERVEAPLVELRCESCAMADEARLATTTSRNPSFAGYRLCSECAAEYDSRR